MIYVSFMFYIYFIVKNIKRIIYVHFYFVLIEFY